MSLTVPTISVDEGEGEEDQMLCSPRRRRRSNALFAEEKEKKIKYSVR